MPKGKNKKAKRRNAPKRDSRETSRALQDILILGTRRGGEKGIYQRTFLLPDESEIRTLENSLSPIERRVLRAWLLCNMPSTNRKGKRENNIINFLINGNAETWRAVFATSIMGALHELWSADGHSNLPAYCGTEHLGKRFSGALKKQFRNQQMETYHEQLRDLIYADHVTARMSCIANWDAILPGENPVLWSRNALEILERFAEESQLSYLRMRRDTLIISLIRFTAGLIPSHMGELAGSIRDLGISCSYGMRPDIEPNLPAFSPLLDSHNLGRDPLPFQQISELYDDNEKSNEALCQTALMLLTSSETYEALSRHLTDAFSEIEILYAAISLMADRQTVSAASAAIQSLFAVITFFGFPCNIVDYGYTTRDYRKINCTQD